LSKKKRESENFAAKLALLFKMQDSITKNLSLRIFCLRPQAKFFYAANQKIGC